jgi:predicted ATPase with chaperone activity
MERDVRSEQRGPPGSAKPMIAKRIPSIVPLTLREAIETTKCTVSAVF